MSLKYHRVRRLRFNFLFVVLEMIKNKRRGEGVTPVVTTATAVKKN